ncbi:FACT complex subunit SPT16 N-terminal lobe domain-containing protein [Roridomyces roridus]|uniref:FACT complex subunit SPT16 N-terminal lobe domain-containing protein n=1 Tax=Roridomyces roridus TaxID=1738132 RepID=A0AAD7CJ62_9AGAR|nr:FACT complex subunit SPT16 N-terminal lobe domain-containing protein [Roridomyces roridus]
MATGGFPPVEPNCRSLVVVKWWLAIIDALRSEMATIQNQAPPALIYLVPSPPRKQEKKCFVPVYRKEVHPNDKESTTDGVQPRKTRTTPPLPTPTHYFSSQGTRRERMNPHGRELVSRCDMHWAPLEGHVALTLCDSQQWLLGYEFPSTLILFGEDKVTILCSASKAKILSQIEGTSGPVPVEILAQAKKEQTNDSLDRFFQL